MAILIPPTLPISVGSTDNIAVDMTLDLDGSEVINSATVTEVTTSDLTIASDGPSTTTLDINNTTVAIGKAIQASVSGQSLATTYTLLLTYTTDSTPARTLTRWVKVVGV